jgi:hypothetical protein
VPIENLYCVLDKKTAKEVEGQMIGIQEPVRNVLLQTIMPRLQNNRDSLQSLFCYIPVIALRPVPLPLKLKCCILVISIE